MLVLLQFSSIDNFNFTRKFFRFFVEKNRENLAVFHFFNILDEKLVKMSNLELEKPWASVATVVLAGRLVVGGSRCTRSLISPS